MNVTYHRIVIIAFAVAAIGCQSSTSESTSPNPDAREGTSGRAPATGDTGGNLSDPVRNAISERMTIEEVEKLVGAKARVATDADLREINVEGRAYTRSEGRTMYIWRIENGKEWMVVEYIDAIGQIERRSRFSVP